MLRSSLKNNNNIQQPYTVTYCDMYLLMCTFVDCNCSISTCCIHGSQTKRSTAVYNTSKQAIAPPIRSKSIQATHSLTFTAPCSHWRIPRHFGRGGHDTNSGSGRDRRDDGSPVVQFLIHLRQAKDDHEISGWWLNHFFLVATTWWMEELFEDPGIITNI